MPWCLIPCPRRTACCCHSLNASQIGTDKESFEARVAYQKMERISNSLFLELDADGGGSIDESEFVDGLLESDALWRTFDAINPIRKFRDLFRFLEHDPA